MLQRRFRRLFDAADGAADAAFDYDAGHFAALRHAPAMPDATPLRRAAATLLPCCCQRCRLSPAADARRCFSRLMPMMPRRTRDMPREFSPPMRLMPPFRLLLFSTLRTMPLFRRLRYAVCR